MSSNYQTCEEFEQVAAVASRNSGYCLNASLPLKAFIHRVDLLPQFPKNDTTTHGAKNDPLRTQTQLLK